MDAFALDLIAVFALSSGLSAAMIWLGVQIRALDIRETRRRCPACGPVVQRARDCRYSA
jgi:hypothetical protein